MNTPGRNLIMAMLAGVMLSACITIPEQLKGEFSALTPAGTTEKNLQTNVRWGGVILETRPEKDHTCFEILARKLDSSMRPANTEQSTGRFVACRPGFYDPEVFKKKRAVTVTGPIIHIDIRKVGDYDYPFPVVDIDFISLWPKPRNRVYYNYWGGYSPYYWHYPHYGRFYRYPYY